MYICKECFSTFNNPSLYDNGLHECHGLHRENIEGCPYCGQAFTQVKQCSGCGDYALTDNIYIVDDKVYCDNCVQHMVLEDYYGRNTF